MERPMIIGIAGGTGSGKTTLTRQICKHFEGSVSVIYHDNYYNKNDNLSLEQRQKLNYDHPNAFETSLMVKHLSNLRDGKSIECPIYDFTVHNRSEQTKLIKSAKVIIVEGILVFEEKKLRDLMDIKIFVDTDADTRILRRLMRDVDERGRSVQSVVSQYLTTVKPMHEQFVEPSKRFADIIVLDGGYNLVAIDMIMNKIQRHIEN